MKAIYILSLFMLPFTLLFSQINRHKDATLSMQILADTSKPKIKVKNSNTQIKRDQNIAGRDIKISNKNYNDRKSVKTDNRKITINGPAFFDSSKQINIHNIPDHRHLTPDDEQLIKRFLPISYPIWFYYCNANPECQYFAEEVHYKFEQWGYKFNGSGLYIGDARKTGQPWFLEKDTVNKRAVLYVYSKY